MSFQKTSGNCECVCVLFTSDCLWKKNSFVLIQHKVPPPSLTDRLDDTPPPHFICSDAVNVSLHFQMKYHYFSCRISVKYLSAHFHLCMRLKCVCVFESRMQRDLFDLFLTMKISTRRFNCQHLRLWAFIDHSQECLWSSVIKMQLSGMFIITSWVWFLTNTQTDEKKNDMHLMYCMTLW